MNNFYSCMQYRELSREESFERMDELRVLTMAAYGTHASVMEPQEAKAMQERLAENPTWELLLNTSTCFICESGQTIVGLACLIRSGNPWRFFEAAWSYIRMVGVHPEYMGRGIGRELTMLCIDLAKKNNEKFIALHTSEMMAPARKLYESLGFRIHKEIEPQWGQRYWVYLLEIKDKK